MVVLVSTKKQKNYYLIITIPLYSNTERKSALNNTGRSFACQFYYINLKRLLLQKKTYYVHFSKSWFPVETGHILDWLLFYSTLRRSFICLCAFLNSLHRISQGSSANYKDNNINNNYMIFFDKTWSLITSKRLRYSCVYAENLFLNLCYYYYKVLSIYFISTVPDESRRVQTKSLQMKWEQTNAHIGGILPREKTYVFPTISHSFLHCTSFWPTLSASYNTRERYTDLKHIHFPIFHHSSLSDYRSSQYGYDAWPCPGWC